MIKNNGKVNGKNLKTFIPLMLFITLSSGFVLHKLIYLRNEREKEIKDEREKLAKNKKNFDFDKTDIEKNTEKKFIEKQDIRKKEFDAVPIPPNLHKENLLKNK
jgi:F0F1-type ATP synthase membrane subunit b/b'